MLTAFFRVAHADSKSAQSTSPSSSAVVSAGGTLDAAAETASDRAKRERLVNLFRENATKFVEGRQLMTFDDFQRAVMPPDTHSLKAERIRWLWEIADRDHSGSIDLDEFLKFESLMSSPYADFEIAWALFDPENKGFITREEFKSRIDGSAPPGAPPFNINSDWVQRYFGHTNHLSYKDFSQSLKTLGSERMRQAFVYFDKTGSGIITGRDMEAIVHLINDGRLPTAFKDRVAHLAGLTDPRAHITYSEYVAFQYLLRDLSHHDAALREACARHNGSISADEYVRVAKSGASFEITPLEIDLLFRAFGNKFDNRIHLNDYTTVVGNNLTESKRRYQKLNWAPELVKGPAPVAPKSTLQRLRETAENFGLGAIAGGIGAAAVYPIDLVKTRMQNQRLAGEGALKLYNNPWDCFKKVLHQEGARGLYRGLGPQLLGVAPEKAIKLTVNDLLRDLFEDKSRGRIHFPLEVLAGGCAGASQVIFTNPIEIVKIRLQSMGENVKLGLAPKSTMQILAELGLGGLYKGAGACLMRDIPFSAIYFPTYAKTKEALRQRHGGPIRPIDLLLAGALAGIPAAWLVTPADVVKTRLQVEARKGQATYSGIVDCFMKVLHAEGPTALFKGGLMRVFRSSPQFGVTLLAYELLHNVLAPHLPHRPLVNSPISIEELDGFRRQRIVDKVTDVERKWGLQVALPDAPAAGASAAAANDSKSKPKK